MKRFHVFTIAAAAILMVSCNSQTEKKVSESCVCTCQCDSCQCTTQKQDDLLDAVGKTLDKTQTKALTERTGACHHGACSCKRYVSAHNGGKCVCGHWDYVHYAN